MPQPSPDSLQATLEHGLSLTETNQLHDAEAVFRKLLEHFPNQPDALHMLGVLSYKQGRLDEAYQFMLQADQILASPPEHYLCNLGIVLFESNRDEEAISAFSRALNLNQKLYEAHGRMGYSLLKLGQINDALCSVVRAIQIKPDYPDGFFYLGSVLLAMGRKEDGLLAFRESMRLIPESYTAVLLGNAFNQLGYNQEALECYRFAYAPFMGRLQAGDMRRESNAILRTICASLTGRILSIGSGQDLDKEGNFYREYFPAGSAYIRLDSDSRLLPDIIGDAQNMRDAIPDHACDVVFCIWALEHVPDVQAALAEIHRVLRPGGAFIFGLPLNEDFHSFPHDYHRFTLDGIKALFHGLFHMEEVYPIGEETPLVLDPRLTLFGAMPGTAPASFVGICKALPNNTVARTQ
ncbi:MAG: tetratricopeptide repeat protein [Thermodesulfobacteriota bacterium]